MIIIVLDLCQCICLYGASALASVPARLTLAELAAFPKMPSAKYHVIMGNTIAVNFPVPDGSPPPTFQFFKNGVQIQSEFNFNIFVI